VTGVKYALKQRDIIEKRYVVLHVAPPRQSPLWRQLQGWLCLLALCMCMCGWVLVCWWCGARRWPRAPNPAISERPPKHSPPRPDPLALNQGHAPDPLLWLKTLSLRAGWPSLGNNPRPWVATTPVTSCFGLLRKLPPARPRPRICSGRLRR
jgi:hypothetical protein